MLRSAILYRAILLGYSASQRTVPVSSHWRRFGFAESEVNHRPLQDPATKSILAQFGFSEQESEKILTSCSLRGPIRSQSLLESVTFWSSLQLAPGDLNSLLVNNTDLLYANQEQCTKVHQFLSNNFTKKQLKKIFLNSPQVVHRPPSAIEECMQFLEVEKKVTRSEIANSGALAHSLRYIRVRLEFLERAGLYTVPTKKVAVENPRMDLIVNATDKDFATKVAGLSLDEYDVFKELFGKEDEAPLDFEEI